MLGTAPACGANCKIEPAAVGGPVPVSARARTCINGGAVPARRVHACLRASIERPEAFADDRLTDPCRLRRTPTSNGKRKLDTHFGLLAVRLARPSQPARDRWSSRSPLGRITYASLRFFPTAGQPWFRRRAELDGNAAEVLLVADGPSDR